MGYLEITARLGNLRQASHRALNNIWKSGSINLGRNLNFVAHEIPKLYI